MLKKWKLKNQNLTKMLIINKIVLQKDPRELFSQINHKKLQKQKNKKVF